jgi:hypothetical protein
MFSLFTFGLLWVEMAEQTHHPFSCYYSGTTDCHRLLLISTYLSTIIPSNLPSFLLPSFRELVSFLSRAPSTHEHNGLFSAQLLVGTVGSLPPADHVAFSKSLTL